MITKDLLNRASIFRYGIESALKEGCFSEDISFSHFPSGCCGDAADLLGQYLLDYGIQTKRVCGIHGYGDERNPQTHAWLQYGNIVIDITGDQFFNRSEFHFYNNPVYVGPMDQMHSTFSVYVGNVRDIVDLSSLGANVAPRLLRLYRTIVSHTQATE